MFKFLCSPLIRPQWSFLGVLWLYHVQNGPPKGPNLTSFVPSTFTFFKKMVKKAKVFSIKLAVPRHMSISVILEILQGRKRFQKTHQNLWMTYSRKVLQALKLNLIFLRSFKFNLSGSFQFGEFPLANFRILLILLKLYSNTEFFFIKLL